MLENSDETCHSNSWTGENSNSTHNFKMKQHNRMSVNLVFPLNNFNIIFLVRALNNEITNQYKENINLAFLSVAEHPSFSFDFHPILIK